MRKNTKLEKQTIKGLMSATNQAQARREVGEKKHHVCCHRKLRNSRLGQRRSRPSVSINGIVFPARGGMQADVSGFCVQPTPPEKGTPSPVTPIGNTQHFQVLDGTIASLRLVRSNCIPHTTRTGIS